MDKVFISYRRDDAAGYAGRLEESLENQLGHGTVFRDVLDIPPGADFVAAIRARLAQAETVLVVIGPRWAGDGVGGEARRLDDPQDFVRLEVALALESRARVVPVLLPGVTMPAESTLPDELKPLARRNAIALTDTNWAADVERLGTVIGASSRRRGIKWAVVGALVLATVMAGWFGLPSLSPPVPPLVRPDTAGRLMGIWKATVRYDWGDSFEESFEFKRHAGALTGTATFLKYPLALEALRVEGGNLHFETRNIETMAGSDKEVTRHYDAELRGPPSSEVLAFRMVISGSHTSHPPIEFEARRGEPTSAATP